MPFIVVNNRSQYFNSKEDLLDPHFQLILRKAHSYRPYKAICSCQGTGREQVDLVIFRANGRYNVRHGDHKPHTPDCPLYIPAGGVLNLEERPLVAKNFRDEDQMTFEELRTRVEAANAALSAVARRTHDQLGWESFSARGSGVIWNDFVKEVRNSFHTLPTKEGPTMGEYLQREQLTLVVASVPESKYLGQLSKTCDNHIPIFVRQTPNGWCEAAMLRGRGCIFSWANDYCRILGNVVPGPYLLLGLMDPLNIITRCVLMPIYTRGNRFCLVESNEERLLAFKLSGSAFKGWLKPTDESLLRNSAFAQLIFGDRQSAAKMPRMDFIARIEHKLVVIEHYGFDNPEYNLARRKKLQFAHKHFLKNGIYYWDSVYAQDRLDHNPNCVIHDFQIHEYRPDRSHGIFNLNQMDVTQYEELETQTLA